MGKPSIGNNGPEALDVSRGRPNQLTTVINKGWAFIHWLGLFPNYPVTLVVVGRQSGKVISFRPAMTVMNEERYLVSMLGENTNWVRNIRAAQRKAKLIHGLTEEVLWEEVHLSKRALVIKAFLRHAAVSEFEKIAGKYPVVKVNAPR